MSSEAAESPPPRLKSAASARQARRCRQAAWHHRLGEPFPPGRPAAPARSAAPPETAGNPARPRRAPRPPRERSVRAADHSRLDTALPAARPGARCLPGMRAIGGDLGGKCAMVLLLRSRADSGGGGGVHPSLRMNRPTLEAYRRPEQSGAPAFQDQSVLFSVPSSSLRNALPRTADGATAAFPQRQTPAEFQSPYLTLPATIDKLRALLR